MMKNALIILLLMCGMSYVLGTTASASLLRKVDGRIQLQVDLEFELRLQKEVDKGHQPWRLDPVDVAYVAVASSIDSDIKYEQCFLLYDDKQSSTVQCNGRELYTILLKRFIREDGILTAQEITW